MAFNDDSIYFKVHRFKCQENDHVINVFLERNNSTYVNVTRTVYTDNKRP